MGEGIEFLDLGTDDPNVIGLKATGKVTAEAIAALVERLESVRSAGHKARLYVDLRHYEGSELPVIKEKLAHMSTFWRSIDRCAYVVDSTWMSTAIGLVDAVTPMHLRAFDSEHDAQARSWILSTE